MGLGWFFGVCEVVNYIKSIVGGIRFFDWNFGFDIFLLCNFG